MVSEAEASHLSRELASQFAELFNQVIRISAPFRQLLAAAKVRTALLEQTKAEITALKQAIPNVVPSDNPPAYMHDQLKDLQTKAANLEAQHKEEGAQILPLRLNVFTQTFAAMNSVQYLIVKFVCALRRELNLPTDEAQFVAQHQDMERRAWASVHKTFGIEPVPPLPVHAKPH